MKKLTSDLGDLGADTFSSKSFSATELLEENSSKLDDIVLSTAAILSSCFLILRSENLMISSKLNDSLGKLMLKLSSFRSEKMNKLFKKVQFSKIWKKSSLFLFEPE